MAQAHIGFATTVDLVQQQQYSTSSIHGVKRGYGQIDENLADHFAFTDVAYVARGETSEKRQRLGIRDKNRIEASGIRSIAENNNNAFLLGRLPKPLSPSTPGPSQNPLLSLAHPHYGLPGTLVKNFASLGMNSIYPWQSSCLLGRGILNAEKNLVYTAPTGGGKSLVADVLMLKRVIEDPSKKAILILPYVALVQEKLKWLRKVVEGVTKHKYTSSQSDLPNSELPKWRKPHSSSIRVVGFFGGSKARVTWSDVDIAVCTIEKVMDVIDYISMPMMIYTYIEKANALVNTAIEECTIDDLGVVVLDELHMINDDFRGYLMEIIASKLLVLERPVQIVGMSATLTVRRRRWY